MVAHKVCVEPNRGGGGVVAHRVGLVAHRGVGGSSQGVRGT